jgi:p-aminobenzoyl-glutamate transporter AbgT
MWVTSQNWKPEIGLTLIRRQAILHSDDKQLVQSFTARDEGNTKLKSSISATLIAALAVQACAPMTNHNDHATELTAKETSPVLDSVPLIMIVTLAIALASGGRSGGAGSCSSITPYVC